jgi:hypothetical protein
LEAWEQEVNRLLLVSSALENEGVKRLLEELNSQITLIDEKLLESTSEELNDRMRDRLIDQKRHLKRIVSYFTSAPEQLASLTNEIDKNL